MKVSDLMSQKVELASPDDSIQQAAKAMARIDSGMLPVGENDRLVGIAHRPRYRAFAASAKGKIP